MYRDRDRDARFHGRMTAWASLHDQEQPARFLMRHMSNTVTEPLNAAQFWATAHSPMVTGKVTGHGHGHGIFILATQPRIQ
jgi:hypothetical protein